MSDLSRPYRTLIDLFLKGKLSAEEFCEQYFAMMKQDDKTHEEHVGWILDELCGDADAFTRNAALVAEKPNLFINEEELRRKAELAAARLADAAQS